MSRLIQCGTCGYPLTPEERNGLVEVDGVMVKPEQRTALPDAITDDSESQQYRNGWNECREVMKGMMK